MGKKSRLKKERREAGKQLATPISLKSLPVVRENRAELIFDKSANQLREFFYKYKAEEVCLALNVLAIWLPNISSQIKSYFAMSVFLSCDPDKFSNQASLETYPSFEQFCKFCIKNLPLFRMHEDYVPEIDWGEIRVESNHQLFRIFYGGPVECLYDFIQSYKMVFQNSSNPEFKKALDDLHIALQLQDYFISRVERDLFPKEIKIRTAHIEVPGVEFWLKCRESLSELSESYSYWSFSNDLIVDQSTYDFPKSQTEFINSLYKPDMHYAGVRINKKIYPTSIRFLIGVLLDRWGTKLEQKLDLTAFGKNFNEFLFQRFRSDDIITGPFTLLTKKKSFNVSFLSGLFTGKKAFFFVPYDKNIENDILNVENELERVGNSQEDWVVCDSKGSIMNIFVPAENVELVFVIPKVSTIPRGDIRINPKLRCRYVLLYELIAILDSVENNEEFENFWKYYDEHIESLGPTGLSDIYGSFKDSDKVLVEGAVTFSLISIDPHWGSNLRHKELTEFWEKAPGIFPDNSNIAWEIKENKNNTQTLIAKGKQVIAHHCVINGCSVFFIFVVDTHEIDVANGRILELVCDCLTDSCATRASLIDQIQLFHKKRIITTLEVDKNYLLSQTEEPKNEDIEDPLFTSWGLIQKSENFIEVNVKVNLCNAYPSLMNPVDAAFEARVLIEWLTGLTRFLDLELAPSLIASVDETKSRLPRYTISRFERAIDAPDFGTAIEPEATQYKLARKQMAIAFQAVGAEPGVYELGSAKQIIDKARDYYRNYLHSQIAEFDRDALLQFCVEQADIVMSVYDRESKRIRLSIRHEVDFDRAERLAEVNERFSKNSKNYRYLLEVALSANTAGSRNPTAEDVSELIASVDWLYVMYAASDALHNGIDVGGVVIDDSFVPEVFYSGNIDGKEELFNLEEARYRLGQSLRPEDEVNPNDDDKSSWERIDSAFLKDVGFSFSNLIQILMILSKWPSANDGSNLSFIYKAPKDEIIEVILKAIGDIGIEDAGRIIDFLILEPGKVRMLEGKSIYESDVPVWEHNKRTSRFTIRPLIPINDFLIWGPTLTARSFSIWQNSIAEGYLPGDFPWANVKKIVRNFKESIEKQLELKSFEIVQRFTKYAQHGIDFKYRFPKEAFADVGDYDVLSYWPEQNTWLAVEAKYNQPPFCLKDGRRLRDRIFGNDEDKAQFSKIEGRRKFLKAHTEKLRALLGWPAGNPDKPLKIQELYVSRNIYWWMRSPPYEVSADFVRVDALHEWMEKHFSRET